MGVRRKGHDLAGCAGCKQCMTSMEKAVSEVMSTKGESRKRLLRTWAQGAVVSGGLSVYEGLGAIMGTKPDVKLMAYAVAHAFVTGVIAYVHRRK